MTDTTKMVTEYNEIDSAKFEDTISSILCGLGAQKYIDIFKKQNIDQYSLAELSEEDLIKLGVDDADVRSQLMEHAKLIPAYDEASIIMPNLGPIEIVDVFEECTLLLHRIHLSMVANNTALTKTKKVSDCLLYKDKYASNIALATLSEISNILNSMDNAVHTQLQLTTKQGMNSKKKKLIVGTVGSAVIAILAFLLKRSLKQLE
ncbi:uncharacterized protein LOC113504411 [Trichoplusia ni]|uniref:Uncharacterized protein LOC113504411 n=1 Tax=Trichoplusia ni TaxID=7111 RepID=A0A7E5WP33_TRINI|nr:uncharacterized protein LOC113504411 [Trichoplusia ni]